MANYPLPTLAAQITDEGISAPSYADILGSLKASFSGIYGSDAYLEPDSQDGQMLAVFAQAIHDCNQTSIAVYNSFSPTFARGAGLSRLVKINGLRRDSATFSTVPVAIVGVEGTLIQNGIIQDQNENLWNLPSSVLIPSGGTVTVTAVAQEQGAIAAPIGTVNKIYTPWAGWQSVNNASAAIPGAAVENDAELRRRQSLSTSLPALTPVAAILASVENISGVTRARIYENDTSSTDGNSIPSHSISLVVAGGDVNAIANAIASKKGPGCGTYGSTTINVVDPKGIPYAIKFYILANTNIWAVVNVTALTGYVSSTTTQIKQAIVDFINNLDIGQDVIIDWVEGVATLINLPVGKTFKVTSVTIGFSSGSQGTSDLAVAFNAAAASVIGNITVNVT